MRSESEITRWICRQVRNRGWVAVTIAGGSVFQTPGMPDRWFAACNERGSWHGWIEFKSEDGSLRADQRLCIRKMRSVDPWCCFVARLMNVGTTRLEDADGAVLFECGTQHGVDLLETIMEAHGR